jgi:signal transduction histidine kinase
MAEARGLSPAIPAVGATIGALLWLYGSYGHRFWIVMLLTLAAGIYGLYFGPAYGMQPMVAGLLLAVSTGTLGLALMRVLAFVAGGLAALWLTHVVALSYDEPLVFFLLGGLAGVLLIKLWITALSSLAGTLLMAYSSLCLIDRFVKLDSAAWAAENTALLNWAVVAFAVLGTLTQFLLHRRRQRKEAEKAETEKKEAAEAQAVAEAEEERKRKPPPKPKKATRWWQWPLEQLRKAG